MQGQSAVWLIDMQRLLTYRMRNELICKSIFRAGIRPKCQRTGATENHSWANTSTCIHNALALALWMILVTDESCSYHCHRLVDRVWPDCGIPQPPVMAPPAATMPGCTCACWNDPMCWVWPPRLMPAIWFWTCKRNQASKQWKWTGSKELLCNPQIKDCV